MVDAATALMRAGATGVMVDNSAATHSPTDWFTLAGDDKPGGLYWIFTTLNGGDEEVGTNGQHCLGLRDAEVPRPPDEELAYLLVHNFRGYVYQSGKTVHDGDVVARPAGAVYRATRHPFTRVGPAETTHRATQHPFTRVEPDSPLFIPVGAWRLARVEEGEPWAKESYHPIR